MANENLTLYVASYADGAAAEADFRALKEAEGRRTSRCSARSSPAATMPVR